MPSGVRVTIALIVVAFVGIGLYYANLENTVVPTHASDSGGVVRSDEDPQGTPEPSTPSPAVITTVPGADSDVAAPVVAAGGEEEDEQQHAALASGTTAGEESRDAAEDDAEELAAADALKPENDQGEEPGELTAAQPQEVEVVATRVSRGIPARGTSVHLLADPFMSGIDREAIQQDFIDSGSLQGPAGTAWVRIADWIEPPLGEPSPWIVAERDQATWLLVRDDQEGSLDLRGHVLAASERLDQLRGEPLVMFVLDDEATPHMRELTYPNIGHDFTIIVDREAVAVQIIRTAIEARATIAPSCTR